MNRLFAAVASLALVAGLLCLTSYSQQKNETPEKSAAGEKAAAPSSQPSKTVETWDIFLMQGSRVGYAHVKMRHDVEDGRPILRNEVVNSVTINRGGQTTTMKISCSSVETPEGRLLRFDSELLMGMIPIRTKGQVKDETLNLEVTSAGSDKPLRESVPWPADCGGPLAVEGSLLRNPMQPGDTRTIKSLMIDLNRTAKVELTAKEFETVAMPNGAYELLRIDTVTRLPDGQKLRGTIWTNRAGDTLKTHLQALNMTSYRSTEAEALKKPETANLDLMLKLKIPVERPLKDPHHTKQVRYRVHLEDGDPSSAFVVGPTQAVKSIDPKTAEITVYAIRPRQPEGNEETEEDGKTEEKENAENRGKTEGNIVAPADPSTENDLRPNNFIQSDDPLIVADAKKAVGDEKDPWRVAVALESYVHREVKNKNFTQAFATASEVAKSLEGDCTEHAVFLAALARARGIPARVAIGLVYMESQQAFFYHLWTEVYIGERWIPIDGTLALGGIGAAHLKIAQHNLKGASAYSAFVPVLQVAGQLRIEILDAE